MNNTAPPIPRCQMRRMKSNTERLTGHLVTHHAVLRQPIMPRNEACRRLAMLFRSYPVVLSFTLLSIRVPFMKDGLFHCTASTLPPAKQDTATSAAGDAFKHMLSDDALREFDPALSRTTSKPTEAVNVFGVGKQQSLPNWSRPRGSFEGSPDHTHHLRQPASTSLAARRTPTGTVLPAYLLAVEQELRAALRNISPVRRNVVAGAALRSGSSFWPLARPSPSREDGQEGKARNSSVLDSLGAAGTLRYILELMVLPGARVNGLENIAQVWQNVQPLEQEDTHESSVVPSDEAPAGRGERTDHRISPAVTQEYGYVDFTPFDQLLKGRARKTVQHMVNDIVALSLLEQIVSDVRRRLESYLQAEQQLQQRITCLATSDDAADKHVEKLTGRQPDEGLCAGFEEPQNEDDRRAQRLAMEKELNDVQQAAEEASRLLSSIISGSEMDTTFEGYSHSQLSVPVQQLLAAATPSPNHFKDLPYAEPSKNAQITESLSTKEVPQTLLHGSQRKPEKGGTTGLAPRSLSSVPHLPGHTLFATEVGRRRSSAPVSFASSWRMPSASTALFAPRHAYQCFKRTPEGQSTGGVLTCECRQSPEIAAQEATFIEPVICSRVRRTTVHRTRLPVIDQTLDCYPTSYETSAVALPPTSVVRADYMAVQPRQTVMTTEPPLQCQCFKPRTQYECRRALPRPVVPREPLRVIPEVVEHRAVEPVFTPVECEPIQRAETYALPPPVPEPVLVPCECIEHSVQVPEPYYARQEAEFYPAAREPLLIPMECIVKSTQLERVPCECIARPTTYEAPVHLRSPPHEHAAYTECYCPRDDYSPYSVPVYTPYDMAE